ncbi:hypothetical protein GCM10010255_79920 [Streptomyces coeruleofuscus]|uniref:EAL domain-containing protein n=2 Tax=Streptomyces coeruleofuscus TaxID=66879 RepID=A0ABN3JAU9_9ACTN
MAAHIALVTVAIVVYMTVPVAAPAPWAVIGLSGVVAVVTGIGVHRPTQWHRYKPLPRSRRIERHDLQSPLAQAVADKAFALRYQPVVDITGGEVIGFEALVRRPHEQLPLRADLYRKTVRVLDRLEGLGVDTLNTDRLPIVDVPLANPADLDAVAAYLWEEGIYVTLAAYPLVPRDRVGFRIQLTGLNADDDIDRLNGTPTRLSERFPLRLKG